MKTNEEEIREIIDETYERMAPELKDETTEAEFKEALYNEIILLWKNPKRTLEYSKIYY